MYNRWPQRSAWVSFRLAQGVKKEAAVAVKTLVELPHDAKTKQNRAVLTASVITAYTVPIGGLIAACLQIKQNSSKADHLAPP
jgi:hypothetical protein